MYHVRWGFWLGGISLLAMAGCEALGPVTDFEAEYRQKETATEARLRSNVQSTPISTFDDFRELYIDANVLNGCEGDGYTGNPYDNRLERLKMLAARRQKWYVDNTPGLPAGTREDILAGNIVRGMTQNQVLASWGWPERVNSTVTAIGRTEQWIYRDIGRYLYFTNGTLESWQEERVIVP